MDGSSDLLTALRPETPGLRAARDRAEAAGVRPVAAGTGALLRLLARAAGARTVVEVGCDGGYRGLWLLAGMDPRGTLTTIEADGDRHALAQQTYAAAGAGERVRAVHGDPREILPRLRDANYDVVVLASPAADLPGHLEHARRLLRPGGMLVADTGPDPAHAGAVAFGRGVAGDPDLDATLLEGGLVVATRSPA